LALQYLLTNKQEKTRQQRGLGLTDRGLDPSRIVSHPGVDECVNKARWVTNVPSTGVANLTFYFPFLSFTVTHPLFLFFTFLIRHNLHFSFFFKLIIVLRCWVLDSNYYSACCCFLFYYHSSLSGLILFDVSFYIAVIYIDFKCGLFFVLFFEQTVTLVVGTWGLGGLIDS